MELLLPPVATAVERRADTVQVSAGTLFAAMIVVSIAKMTTQNLPVLLTQAMHIAGQIEHYESVNIWPWLCTTVPLVIVRKPYLNLSRWLLHVQNGLYRR